jgi:glycosyltransferase involved in cell wall biosynthesis
MASERIGIKDPIQILFIARTYPPLVGGMERFAEDFYTHLSNHADVKLIANRIGKKHIVFFFFKVLGFLFLNAAKFDIIHFNDAILSPLIPWIRLFSKAKITLTVHGLDVIYAKFGYQRIIIPFLRMADKIFPVSHYTKLQCLDRDIPEEKLHIIPNGLDFSIVEPCQDEVKDQLLAKIGFELHNKTILFSIGRLIRRKGHAWFIENVLDHLPEHYVYLIAGDGPEYCRIQGLINALSLHKRIVLFGYVTDKEKNCLFEMADIFIMPNIKDANDQEGFGIVLLEAGSYSLPSVASNIEGIKDAVLPGETGMLVNEKDTSGYIHAITNMSIDPKKIFQKLRKKYDWEVISQIYLQEFQTMLTSLTQ